MEKLLFIVCFIFTLGNTNAQTKEQTIAWINTYASELLPSVNMSVKENDELVIARGKTKKDYYGKEIIKIGQILTTDASTISEKKYDDGKTSFWYHIFTNGKQITFVGFEGDEHLNNSSETKIYSYSKENLERVVKAINHLAKLCGAKEKPKENTF